MPAREALKRMDEIRSPSEGCSYSLAEAPNGSPSTSPSIL
jgi:hypothetical protein